MNRSAFRLLFPLLSILPFASPAWCQQDSSTGQKAFSAPRPIVQFRAQGGQQTSYLAAPSYQNAIIRPTPVRGPPAGPITAGDVDCMAKALVFEGQSIDFDSLLAVGTIIVNRSTSRSGRWPTTWCGVIAQEKQFSSHPLERTPDPQAYNYALTVAQALQSGLLHPYLAKITEFRTTNSYPPRGMTLVGSFGGNSFYK